MKVTPPALSVCPRRLPLHGAVTAGPLIALLPYIRRSEGGIVRRRAQPTT